MSLSALSLTYAESQIGVSEKPSGSNSGTEIDQYLKSVGLNPGYNWCMAFVYWCVQKAAKEKGVLNPLYKTGGVLKQANERPNLRGATPKVGSIFIMDLGQGKGHTGFVTAVVGNTIKTIEGNTNEAGSRTGIKVMRRTRNISSIKTFLNV